MKGDFNAKIVSNIPGNKEATPNGERRLKMIFEIYHLNIVNANESNAKVNGQECKEKRDQ